MKLKELKCPNCNASISINENTKKGVCNYCNSEFIIDDETIKIEQSTTIELKDDSLQIAKTTLESFKEYDKSLELYRELLPKYPHKREVYIGLIKSLTQDFSITSLSEEQLNEINQYLKKFKLLSFEEEYEQYELKINEMNKNFWYNRIINKTNNFNVKETIEPIETIEKYYNEYQKYCSKKENTIKEKYDDFSLQYKLFLKNKKKKKKIILISIIGIIILIIISFIIILLTDTVKKKTNQINLSEISDYITKKENNYDLLLNYFKNSISEKTVKEINLNKEKKLFEITLIQKNILVKKEKKYDFEVIDDIGPLITPISCKFTDTEDVDLYKCFSLYDLTDGEINSNEAIINKKENDFKSEGIKNIEVIAKDNDGNESKLEIDVTIGKTPINIELSINQKLTVGKSYTPKITISPNTISDKSVTYTYDKNYLYIENNTIRVLKKGNTELCVVSNYDQNIKTCKSLNLELICKDKYTFKVNGNKEVTITAGEAFCTGTYKIYVEVTNKNEFYHIKIKPKGDILGKTMTIYKNSTTLNDEGNKYVLGEGDQVVTDIGITQITLEKANN